METANAQTRIAPRNILFAANVSYSNAALRCALAVARRYGAELYAVHVVIPDAYAFVAPASSRRLAEEEERRLKEEARRLEEQLQGVRHAILVREGDIWNVLAGVIEKHEIDLLLMGTRGRTSPRKALLGSVTEEIFRKAPCPVLTVGPNCATNPDVVVELREILFATDFSPESLAAVRYAISLAQDQQAHLSLLYVLEQADAAIRDPEMSAASVLHRLLSVVPPEAELRCNPKCFVGYGSPADQILAFAEKRHADLIVLGGRQPQRAATPSTHLAQGTAYKVVARAARPVLTVRG